MPRIPTSEDGFTLIELLVVILIIGILAAIALPSFLGQSQKAKDAVAKADARNAVTQVEACLTDRSETPTSCTAANPEVVVGSTVSDGGAVSITSATDYYVEARSTGDDHDVFRITKTGSGRFARSCGAGSAAGGGGKGGCPAGGSW